MTTEMMERAREKTIEMIKDKAVEIVSTPLGTKVKSFKELKGLLDTMNVLVKEVEVIDTMIERSDQTEFPL